MDSTEQGWVQICYLS